MTRGAAPERIEAEAAAAGAPGGPFLPEPLTPLAWTPVYRQLTPGERLCYNRLHGLYVNEQILFFERTLAANVLGALLRGEPPPPLAANLRRFLADETTHVAMFVAFNRGHAPELSAGGRLRFVRPGPLATRALAAASRSPAALPLFAWLMLLLEERAIHHAREIIRGRQALDPAYVRLHRAHAADEARHVGWDEAILDLVWPAASPLRRRVTAAVLGWLVGEFFSLPRRASLGVLDELAQRHPRLRPRLPELRRALRALAAEPAYHQSLYSRRIVPRTFARFDAWPELHRLGQVLPAYRPGAS